MYFENGQDHAESLRENSIFCVRDSSHFFAKASEAWEGAELLTSMGMKGTTGARAAQKCHLQHRETEVQSYRAVLLMEELVLQPTLI